MSSYSSDAEFGAGAVAIAIGLVIVVLGAILWFAGATWEAIPNDKIALHYTGGPFQGVHFVKEIPPGTKTKYYGEFEHLYLLPATQRTYIVSRDNSGGDKSGIDTVNGVTNDQVAVAFEASVYFKLNTDSEVIKQFFNNVCLHDHCWDLSTGGGWDKMLAQYFRPALENAVRIETGRFDHNAVYSNPETLVKMQTDIGQALDDDINRAVGGPYFCGPDSNGKTCTNFGFILKDPQLPKPVEDAYAATAAAKQDAITAQQQAQANVTRAKGDADAQAARAAAPAVPQANTDYIRAQAMEKCAERPDCTLIISEGTGAPGVNVNTK